jgi:sulfoxide reductase heme-binding subunit YedZ
MIRRLGKKWNSLHQLVYLILALGVLHFIWLVKADYLEPTIYAIIALVLLLHRVGPMKRFSLKPSRPRVKPAKDSRYTTTGRT